MMSECCVKWVICKTWTGLSSGILANSADPEQMPQKAASYQGLHCLLKLQEVRVLNETVLVLVQDHFPSLHSETVDPPVLSVL